MSGGHVISAADVGAGEERTMIDQSCGCERLEQRVISFAPGRSDERHTGERQEVLYVAAGRGQLHVDGRSYELEQGTGAFLVPGDSFAVENPGPDELVVVSVTAPCEGEERSQVTVRYADRESLPATPNREFRFLVNEDLDAGCDRVRRHDPLAACRCSTTTTTRLSTSSR